VNVRISRRSLVVAGRRRHGIIGAFTFSQAWVTYKTSEFAVTDKRVVIKVGWIRRRTLETMLSKVEGIGVDQA
jgi:hypothetical protein